jgi:hypothetical protein
MAPANNPFRIIEIIKDHLLTAGYRNMDMVREAAAIANETSSNLPEWTIGSSILQ